MNCISGIIYFDSNKICDQRVLARMSMCAEGETSVFVQGNIGFSHSTTKDHPQIFFNETKEVIAICDGKLYNNKKIKQELQKRGHRFFTNASEEIIVHLYEEYGDELLQKIEGIFVFVIWDKRRQILLLARDKVGRKEIAFSHTKNCLVFSNRIASLLASDEINREIDREALELYFDLSYIPAPWSIYKHIKKLMPGHYAIFKITGSSTIVDYWNLSEKFTTDFSFTFEDAKEKLYILLKEAVRKQSQAEKSPGLFLSGGLDSTILLALTEEIYDEPIRTFSIGYQDKTLVDETRYVQIATSAFPTNHFQLALLAQDLEKEMPDLLDHLQEPFADIAMFPLFTLAKEASNRVEVVMTGDGADGLFAGDNRYLAEYYRNFYVKIPGVIRNRLIEPFFNSLPVSRENPFLELIRKFRIFCEDLGKEEDVFTRHFLRTQLLSLNLQQRLLGNNVSNEKRIAFIAMKRLYHEIDTEDFMRKMAYLTVKFIHPYFEGVKLSLGSSLNDLHIHTPFLDPSIVELAIQIPGHYKMRGRERKFILKQLFKRQLPIEILRRSKMNFIPPIGLWFKDPLEKLFLDILNSKCDDGLINKEFVYKMFQEHKCGRKDYTLQLWAIFVFQWWLVKNNIKV